MKTPTPKSGKFFKTFYLLDFLINDSPFLRRNTLKDRSGSKPDDAHLLAVVVAFPLLLEAFAGWGGGGCGGIGLNLTKRFFLG